LDIKIQADSVNSGSGMKDGKLKSKDFFNAKEDPLITFHSTKFTQTGPDTIEVDGDFTIRGETKPEKLTFAITAERRIYETNEETNTPFRDGISDRPVGPVKAGMPSL
jgi:polyisoprenoid-binding protein YceI